MVIPVVSQFVGDCKDHLTAEWSEYKKSGKVTPIPICPYAVGGESDIPRSILTGVGNAFKELETVMKKTFNFCVPQENPIVSSEVSVASDGSIFLFPERKPQVQDASGTALEDTTVTLPPIEPPGKRRKAPQTPEGAFMTGTEQVANYMLDHLKRLSESALLAGNLKALYLVLSSTALIKYRVTKYKDVFKPGPPSKRLSATLARCTEMADLVTQNLLNYHMDIIRSSVLHDPASSDWRNERSYEENERSSLCIQMWAYYVQGIRNDLWRYTSVKVGEKILASIFTDSLSLLVSRYTQVEPSQNRLHQYRADIVAILAIVAGMLPSLAATPQQFFSGILHSSFLVQIYRRVDLLVKVAALKGSPLSALKEAFGRGINAKSEFCANSRDAMSVESTPEWMSFFNRHLFPPNFRLLHRLPDNVACFLTLWNAASRPEPVRATIIRGLVMRDCIGAKAILSGLKDLPHPLKRGDTCGGAFCLKHLCTRDFSPHEVYAAVLLVIVKCVMNPQKVANIVVPDMKQCGLWDTLDRSQVWNFHRPPWLHAMVSLMSPYMAAVVGEVLESVPVHPPAEPAHPSQLSVRLEHHLSMWTQQLITAVEGMADTLPLSVIFLAHSFNGILPPTVKPVGGHLIAQLVISAIYSIVNSRESLDQISTSGSISDGQWNMMVSVGERLCFLHEGNYEADLAQMTNAFINRLSHLGECYEDNFDGYTEESVIEGICHQYADVIQSSCQGQAALVVIWEFLIHNIAWVHHALSAPPLVTPRPCPETPDPPGPIPRLFFSSTPLIYNPLYYQDRIFFTRLKQEDLVAFAADWQTVLAGDLLMPKSFITELLKKRPEFQGEAYLSTEEEDMVKVLEEYLT